MRLYGLDRESLWVDELESWRRSSFDTIGVVFDEGVMTEAHPPLYYVLLHYWQMVCGDSEASLRMPSVIAGVLSIIVLFAVGTRLFSPYVGLLASFFLAFSQYAIHESQNARMYSLFLLFSLLSVYTGIPLAKKVFHEERVKARGVVLYLFYSLLACFFHYYGILFIFLQSCCLFIYIVPRRVSLKSFFIVFGLFGLLYALWVPFLLKQVTLLPEVVGWMKPPDITLYWSYFAKVFNSSLVLCLNVLMAMVIVPIGIVVRRKQGHAQLALKEVVFSPIFFITLWFLLPLIVTWVVSYLITPLLSIRSMIHTISAGYILLAYLIFKIPSVGKKLRSFLLLFLLCSSFMGFAFQKRHYDRTRRTQYREATVLLATKIKENPSAALIVVRPTPVPGGISHAENLSYYLTRYRVQKQIDYYSWHDDPNELAGFIDDFVGNDIIVLLATGKGSRTRHYIEENFEIESQHKFHKIRLFLFSKRKDESNFES